MHNLCSSTQYTLGSKGAQVVISPSKQEHPAPSLTTASVGHHKHWSGSRLTACENITVVYSYILILHFPWWLLASSQGTNSPMDTCYPTQIPSLTTCSKGVVPNDNSKLSATPCSFFLSQGDKNKQTKQNTKKTQKPKRLFKIKTKTKILQAGSFCFHCHIYSRCTVLM